MKRARLKADCTLVEVLLKGAEAPIERVADLAHLDATTEEEIAAQIAEEEAALAQDAAAYARWDGERLGGQAAFARRIGMPVNTVRNWEQGKRAPRGPARALLRLLYRRPELVAEIETPAPRAP